MQLQYDELGAGPALILVHGLGGTGNLWGGLAPTLAREFRVVCPDLRGSGRSGCEGEVSTAALAGDLLELAERLKIERAHWVGHSYGSVIVQHLAVNHPSCVLSLGLIGAIQAPSEAARTALRARAAKARAEGLAEVGSAVAQIGTSAQTKAHRPEVAAFVREMVMRQDPQRYALTCEAVVNTVAAAIETLRCPALIVTGDEDGTAPPQVGKAIAEKIQGSQFHILPRCGHWTPVERPRELTDLLLNFLFSTGRLP